MAIALASDVAPYSLPIECLSFRPTADIVIRKFNNKDSERSIHGYLPLRPKEEQELKALDEYCVNNHIQFSDYMMSKRTRYISRARGKIAAAVTKMKDTEEWRNTVLAKPIRDDEPELARVLRLGVVYFGGRDKFLRPFLVLVPKRIPIEYLKKGNFDLLLRVLIFIMEYLQRYMLVAGRVENVSLLIDFEGLTLTQLPVNALKKIVGVLSNHYIGRMYKIFVVHAPAFVSMLYSVAKNFITDRQQQKIQFLHNDCSELKGLFHQNQLEKRYGGTREDLVEPFYPFQFTSGPFGLENIEQDSGKPPDAHVVLSQQIANGGCIWESQAVDCPTMVFLFETTRQREILSLSGLLPAEDVNGELNIARTASELYMAKIRSESANSMDSTIPEAKDGITVDRDIKDGNSPSTIASETSTQQPKVALELATTSQISNRQEIISTMPEVGSVSGRSLQEVASESNTGSERIFHAKSLGDTISNVSQGESASDRKAASEREMVPLVALEETTDIAAIFPTVEVIEDEILETKSPRMNVAPRSSMRYLFCCT